MPNTPFSILPLITLTVLLCACNFTKKAMPKATTNESPSSGVVAIKSNDIFIIDGKIEEAQWGQVNWHSGFSGKGLKAPEAFSNRFKIMYDEAYLFVALEMADSAPDSIPMLPSPRDNNSNDWVEVDFDTNQDKKSAYAFVVSPYGVRGDMFITGDDDNFNDAFHPKWEVKTSLTDEGWTAEMKIPFDQLLIPDQPEHSWGLQITRYVSRKDRSYQWHPVPTEGGGWVRHFGTLRGISGIKGKQEVVEKPYNPDKEFTPKELKEDFNLLKAVLEEVHPALYWFSSKKTTDSLYQTIEAELNTPMTEFEFYKKLSPIFSYLGDGHGWIRPSRNFNRTTFQQKKMLALGVKIVDQQIFITKDFSGNSAVVKGMEILSINDLPVKDIIEKLSQYVFADGKNQTWKTDQISNNFSYYLSFLLGSQENFALQVKNIEGKTINLIVKGLLDDSWLSNSLPAMQNNYRDNNWNYHLLNDSTAYLSIYTFAFGSSFRNYMDQAFEQINKDVVSRLIIDVRDNGGGNDSNAKYLFSLVAKEPFYYFDRYETKTPESVDFIDLIPCCISNEEIDFIKSVSSVNKDGIQVLTDYEKSGYSDPSQPIPPLANAFTGELYLLINGGTFSTSADFASMVHHTRRGTIIGEETGGGYYGNTSGIDKVLILPNTLLRSRINLIKFIHRRSGEQSVFGRGVFPDHVVKTNQVDIAAGIDTELTNKKGDGLWQFESSWKQEILSHPFSKASRSTATTPLLAITCAPARLAKRAISGKDIPAARPQAAILITVSPAPLTSRTLRALVG